MHTLLPHHAPRFLPSAVLPLLLSLTLLSSLLPTLCHAYGQEGHSVVAELAQRQLSVQDQARLAKVLGNGVSLASISNWADGAKFDTHKETYGEHFVSLPLAQSSYLQSRDCKYSRTPSRAANANDTSDSAEGTTNDAAAAPVVEDGVCIVAAIERYTRQASDVRTSRQQRKEAIAFLVHLLGDLHQPLHTVAEARGGNDVRVFFFNSPDLQKTSPTNLHQVWDSGLFRAQYYAWGAYVDVLYGRYFLDGGADGATVRGIRDDCTNATAPVTCWTLQSHALANSIAYPVAQGERLGQAYLERAKPVLDQLLVLASMRLAQLLHGVLAQGE